MLSLTLLGLAEDRWKDLAERLVRWQWPDGGWNCDLEPRADTSSFFETLLPMRGLASYSGESGRRAALSAARRAAEVFLTRRLYRRRTDGSLIRPDFLRIHYPVYYHYDALAGLRGLREVGRLRDPRCADAIEWLAAKRLSDGGWPSEGRYYRSVTDRPSVHGELVEWGGVSTRKANPWVTVEALDVLAAAGRIDL